MVNSLLSKYTKLRFLTSSRPQSYIPIFEIPPIRLTLRNLNTYPACDTLKELVNKLIQNEPFEDTRKITLRNQWDEYLLQKDPLRILTTSLHVVMLHMLFKEGRTRTDNLYKMYSQFYDITYDREKTLKNYQLLKELLVEQTIRNLHQQFAFHLNFKEKEVEDEAVFDEILEKIVKKTWRENEQKSKMDSIKELCMERLVFIINKGYNMDFNHYTFANKSISEFLAAKLILVDESLIDILEIILHNSLVEEKNTKSIIYILPYILSGIIAYDRVNNILDLCTKLQSQDNFLLSSFLAVNTLLHTYLKNDDRKVLLLFAKEGIDYPSIYEHPFWQTQNQMKYKYFLQHNKNLVSLYLSEKSTIPPSVFLKVMQSISRRIIIKNSICLCPFGKALEILKVSSISMHDSWVPLMCNTNVLKIHTENGLFARLTIEEQFYLICLLNFSKKPLVSNDSLDIIKTHLPYFIEIENRSSRLNLKTIEEFELFGINLNILENNKLIENINDRRARSKFSTADRKIVYNILQLLLEEKNTKEDKNNIDDGITQGLTALLGTFNIFPPDFFISVFFYRKEFTYSFKDIKNDSITIELSKFTSTPLLWLLNLLTRFQTDIRESLEKFPFKPSFNIPKEKNYLLSEIHLAPQEVEQTIKLLTECLENFPLLTVPLIRYYTLDWKINKDVRPQMHQIILTVFQDTDFEDELTDYCARNRELLKIPDLSSKTPVQVKFVPKKKVKIIKN